MSDCNYVCMHVHSNAQHIILKFIPPHAQLSSLNIQMLLQCRELVQQTLKCADLELSMGMSDDYEHAVRARAWAHHNTFQSHT